MCRRLGPGDHHSGEEGPGDERIRQGQKDQEVREDGRQEPDGDGGADGWGRTPGAIGVEDHEQALRDGPAECRERAIRGGSARRDGCRPEQGDHTQDHGDVIGPQQEQAREWGWGGTPVADESDDAVDAG